MAYTELKRGMKVVNRYGKKLTICTVGLDGFITTYEEPNQIYSYSKLSYNGDAITE